MKPSTLWNVGVLLFGVWGCPCSIAEGQYLGDPYVKEALQASIEQVDSSLGVTLAALTDPNAELTPALLLQKERYPTAAARKMARGEEIIQLTLKKVSDKVKVDGNFNGGTDDLISPGLVTQIIAEAGCSMTRPDPDCSDTCFHKKYRTIDGTCNNEQHPLWGSSLIPLNRLLPAVYENNLDTPVGWSPDILPNGHPLPSARLVSSVIMSAHDIHDDNWYTLMLMQWGQFLDHDIDLVPTNPGGVSFESGKPCSENCKNEMPCFPIPVGKDDPRIKDTECLGFTRSSAACGSSHSFVPRENLNELSSYIDASNVYGSTEDVLEKLRNKTDPAFLKHGIEIAPGKFLLPYDEDRAFSACDMDPSRNDSFCFLAGDKRCNEQLGLLAMHTIWMREHNRLAGKLRNLNPHWDAEKVFQEARKIVGAQVQKITYTDFLPKVLGIGGMRILKPYTGYDDTVDATIINSFATAAFRFGHSLIKPILERLDEKFEVITEGHLPLHLAFFAPYRIKEEQGIDPILRGLLHAAAKILESQNMMSKEVTEHLFEQALDIPLDLAALNVQRGRDHGLPSYNDMREYCGFGRATRFYDLRYSIRNKHVREQLEALYKTVHNMDLFVGGMSEDMVNSRTGPVFGCILAEMFNRLRAGDRFYYENPGVFTTAQLAEIRKSSLARVLCDNGDALTNVQPDAMHRVKGKVGYRDCKNHQRIPAMDLAPWEEDPSDPEVCTSGNP